MGLCPSFVQLKIIFVSRRLVVSVEGLMVGATDWWNTYVMPICIMCAVHCVLLVCVLCVVRLDGSSSPSVWWSVSGGVRRPLIAARSHAEVWPQPTETHSSTARVAQQHHILHTETQRQVSWMNRTLRSFQIDKKKRVCKNTRVMFDMIYLLYLYLYLLFSGYECRLFAATQTHCSRLTYLKIHHVCWHQI